MALIIQMIVYGLIGGIILGAAGYGIAWILFKIFQWDLYNILGIGGFAIGFLGGVIVAHSSYEDLEAKETIEQLRDFIKRIEK